MVATADNKTKCALLAGIYDDAPLEHQTIVTFKRAGFHDSRHNDLTPYEGEPNAQNNAAWDRLMRGK